MPILAYQVGLHRVAIANLSHIANIDGRAVNCLDRKIVEHRSHVRARVQTNVVLSVAEFRGSRRQHQTLGVDGVADIGWRHTLRVQRVGIEVHHDLARLATVRQGQRRALHGRELQSHGVGREIVQLSFGQRPAVDSNL